MGCEQTASPASTCSDIVHLKHRGNRHGNMGQALTPTLLKISPNLQKKDHEMISGVFGNHFLFSQLSKNEIERLVDCVELFAIEKDAIVFREGDSGTMMFIVREGTVLVEETGKNVNILKRGEYFGDIAVVYRSPRSATVKTVQCTQLFGIPEQLVRRAIKEIIIRKFDFIKKTLSLTPIFKQFTARERTCLTQNSIALSFNKGDYIYREGDYAKWIYVVAAGSVEVLAPGKTKAIILANEYFGASIEQKSHPKRTETARAHEEQTTVLAILKKDVEKYMDTEVNFQERHKESAEK